MCWVGAGGWVRSLLPVQVTSAVGKTGPRDIGEMCARFVQTREPGCESDVLSVSCVMQNNILKKQCNDVGFPCALSLCLRVVMGGQHAVRGDHTAREAGLSQ